MKRLLIPALLTTVMICSSADAQQWARKMFETTNHNFGTVARDAKVEFAFKLKNIYVEDVRITGVRTSCGCTTPRIEKNRLKTYEQGAIVAHFNTDRFLGRKGATLTVTIDRPFRAEVQLHVAGFIRDDVVLTPGSVQLGAVEQGAAVEQNVAVSTPGRSDLRILEVKSANPHLSGNVIATRDDWGRLGYRLAVRLDENAPAGYIRDHLMLVTNDRGTEIPVLVEGRVQSAVTVSPAALSLGVLRPGEKVSKRLVVRGAKPFRIKGISSDGGSFEFPATSEQPERSLHLIPVTFVAGADPGKITQEIRIETDLADAATVLFASATVAE